MTPSARHNAILDRLARDGEVTVETLVKQFRVNAVTVRRDLARLERQGLLARTHGGAIASRGSTVEFAFQKRQQTHPAEKAAIARAAAAMVEPGMAVCLDTGTTTLEVARRIAPVANLTVLTSSLAIASVLYPHENIELMLLGGTVRKGRADLFGQITEENLRRFRVHLAFLGADAASPDGLFTTDTHIARVSRAILEGAAKAVLVADHSKFQATSFVKFADWNDIDGVITDAGAPAAVRAWLGGLAAAVTYAAVAARSGKQPQEQEHG
ncbi:MAG TPA: DeoR/GlpR family DNA-binding transcription regulator [Phycisphaerae bacterium]|nr:DeoR/GlpR family DNA-binding transcription regulator [Phycisphaerae bacterium]